MSTENKNTVAFARKEAAEMFEKAQAELQKKSEELEAVKAELEAKTQEDLTHTAKIAELEKIVAEYEANAKDIGGNRKRIETLEDENAKLKVSVEKMLAHITKSEGIEAAAELGKEVIKAVNEGYIEVVALPEEGVAVSEQFFKGSRAKSKKDDDGFVYFQVTRPHAEILLGSEGGLRFVLVGPESLDSLTFKRPRGLYAEDVTVRRHVKDKTSTGTVFWKPVVVEESK